MEGYSYKVSKDEVLKRFETPTGKVSHSLGKNYTIVITELFYKKWYLLKINTVLFLSKYPNKSHNLPILLFTSKIVPNRVIFLAERAYMSNGSASNMLSKTFLS